MLPPWSLMRIPDDAERFRSEVRAFLDECRHTFTPETRARSWMAFDADFSRRLGARGWIGLTWPKAYGGQERSAFMRFVLIEELLAAGAPVSAHWIADRQSGPLILRFGTETQKRTYLPGIIRGESYFGIGMSEPNSGSDLASIRTRATRCEGGWRITGSKIWTTNAHKSHYLIALVRSSGTPEDRQSGLSQFIIDLHAPGVTVNPILDLSGEKHFNEISFDDVLVSDDCLVGAEGNGWQQVNAELAYERSGPERFLSSMALVEEFRNALMRRADQAGLCALGRMAAHLATLRQMAICITARLEAGESPVVEAALMKDLGTTFEQEIPEIVYRIAGDQPDLHADAALARTLAVVTAMAPSFSLRGGTREILRGMIARGLGVR